MPAEVIIGILNYGLILIFGLCLSVEIAGGCESRRQRRTVALLCVLLLLIQIPPWLLFGVDTVKRLYPLIVHLPLTLGLIFLLHKPLGVSIVSVFTAYLCCEILNWVRENVSALTHSVLAGEISYAVLIVPVFLLLRRYFVRAAYEAMTCSRAALGLFGSLPVAFYFFDYATTIYSDALYAGIHAVNESLPALLIVFYVIFLTAYHVQTQRRGSAEMQSSMLEAKWSQAQTEMDAMRRSQAQTAVYQHDMRHHLNMLDGLLSAERPDEAAAYIKKVQADIEAITPRRFCENHLVNLLCSSFTDKAQRQGAVLTVDASLPNNVAISDTELCSLLSNGLENALHAVADLPADQKQISLYCGVRQNKLLIEIRNPCAGPIAMRDGLPVSDRKGHGYGCRSIQAIAQRNGGLCVFSAQQGQFLLQVMLPVLET